MIHYYYVRRTTTYRVFYNDEQVIALGFDKRSGYPVVGFWFCWTTLQCVACFAYEVETVCCRTKAGMLQLPNDHVLFDKSPVIHVTRTFNL